MGAGTRIDLAALVERRWDAARVSEHAALIADMQQSVDLVLAQPPVTPEPWPPALSGARIELDPLVQLGARGWRGGPVHEAGVVELVAGIAAGAVSPVEVVESLIERAGRLDGEVQAWALLDGEGALATAREQASEIAAGTARGLLHGVPLGAKDIYDVAGLPTRAGSKLREDVGPASSDARSVRLLRQAGAIMLGKTHTTEFANSDPAPTRNPWNREHTPGGSSSGSAAGVAARLMPGALGTQTAGSVLRPAAFCGIVGYKPSSGLIALDGVIPLSWSLDHVGPLTRSVADAALLFAVMAGARFNAAAEIRGPLRLGLCAGFLGDKTDAETKAALESAAAKLQAAGARVEPVDSIEPLGQLAVSTHAVIMASEVAAFHLGAHGDRVRELRPGIRGFIEVGAALPATALLAANAQRGVLRRSLAPRPEFDALIVPAAAGTAPQGLASTGRPALNAPWSLIGVPAISIPVGSGSDGLPLGMQLVAGYGEDARLLRAAAWCERVLGPVGAPPLS